ncbi:hypothetical protein PUNSTDRAFT_111109 [Punctularia strigosozonata HHB-11173 SS5]|uniref:uncharacterized protein n=1 Tax=Punctularia strigosozonata (strain HHB-11173) TaxID=741275 RepID=UPI0004416E05|nr:uncharacterized protein PUNSTDRAFT_111109 [Punctularia strigosozonata HHB-11173 SS5]EIN12713.1 hypothetical protein PUNSTDRAFT_111109 [Punctularia strigosozonata HHB-11173 SS5]
MTSKQPQTPLLNDFPELSTLSREDLEDMMSDQTYFQAIFHSLEQVKSLYQAQAELGMANETIARNNLAQQDDLYRIRAETQAAFDEAKALESRWKELEKEQKELYQRFTPQFLLMRLRHATTEQDDISEARASTLIGSSSDGPADSSTLSGRDIDDFVKDFKELRKVYHKRVIWGDRWSAGDVAWPEDE